MSEHTTIYIPDIDVVCHGVPPRPWDCPACEGAEHAAKEEELEAALDEMRERAENAEKDLRLERR
jgi:hypothetical protein